MNAELPQVIYERNLNYDWEKRVAVWHNSHDVFLHDHLGGFNQHFKNVILDKMPPGVTVRTEYLLPQHIKDNYPDLNLQFDAEMMIFNNYFKTFVKWVVPKTHNPENFLCSFFGSPYRGRTWLLCWLHELGWFNFDYGSKNFVIEHYPDEIRQLYQKHIGDDFDDPKKVQLRQQMMQTVKTFGTGLGNQHHLNLLSLGDKVQRSFVCLVAETDPAHCYPFPTEKFLYPVVNSTLWVVYAQPGYHRFLQQYLGFRLYNCFDYEFDSVTDHVDRIAALTAMLQRFAAMTQDEWAAVYRSQQPTIQFNAEHVKSGAFIKALQQFDEVGQ